MNRGNVYTSIYWLNVSDLSGKDKYKYGFFNIKDLIKVKKELSTYSLKTSVEHFRAVK